MHTHKMCAAAAGWLNCQLFLPPTTEPADVKTLVWVWCCLCCCVFLNVMLLMPVVCSFNNIRFTHQHEVCAGVWRLQKFTVGKFSHFTSAYWNGSPITDNLPVNISLCSFLFSSRTENFTKRKTRICGLFFGFFTFL